MQPFSPVNVINEIMENTGCFEDGRELTSIMLVDNDSSSLMFKNDELNLCRHIDSISDQSILFESSRLTRAFLPQLGLTAEMSPMAKYWQAAYLSTHVSSAFREILSQIDTSQKAYLAKEEFKI